MIAQNHVFRWATLICLVGALSSAASPTNLFSQQPIGQAAVQSQPDTITQAKALLASGKRAEAVALLNAAIDDWTKRTTTDPNDAQAQYELARALYELQRDEEARIAIEKAISLKPNIADFRVLRALVHFYAKENAAAEEQYQQAIKLAPNTGSFRLAFARYLASANRHDEAIEQLRASVSNDPDFVTAFLNLGATLIARGQTDEGMTVLKAAVARHPKEAEARETYGQTLQNAGDFKAAHEQYAALAQIDPTSVRAASKLVQLCESLKQIEERDRHIATLRRLFADGHAKQPWFCREQMKVGDQNVMAFEHFELQGPQALKYRFEALDNSGQSVLYRISLGSYDITTAVARETGSIKKDERMYHLDYYKGREHRTYGLFPVKPPSYEETRKMAVEIMEGKRQQLGGSIVPERKG